jgi:3-dehydroquinate dehydratase-2
MASSPKILIINGPNLNALGTREPDIYGHETLADIEAMCEAHAKKLGMKIEFYQSNHEGELVDRIQLAVKGTQGVILNAGAYTHTSVAIMDALLLLSIPVIEVHLSNIFQRERFRHQSYVSLAARGIICGFGSMSYILALDAMKKLTKS